jgi:hypothetical protein
MSDIADIIADGVMDCPNCEDGLRLVSPTGEVEDCPDCDDEGWNLYEAADAILP